MSRKTSGWSLADPTSAIGRRQVAGGVQPCDVGNHRAGQAIHEPAVKWRGTALEGRSGRKWSLLSSASCCMPNGLIYSRFVSSLTWAKLNVTPWDTLPLYGQTIFILSPQCILHKASIARITDLHEYDLKISNSHQMPSQIGNMQTPWLPWLLNHADAGSGALRPVIAHTLWQSAHNATKRRK